VPAAAEGDEKARRNLVPELGERVRHGSGALIERKTPLRYTKTSPRGTGRLQEPDNRPM
jgi:hypothetical protein